MTILEIKNHFDLLIKHSGKRMQKPKKKGCPSIFFVPYNIYTEYYQFVKGKMKKNSVPKYKGMFVIPLIPIDQSIKKVRRLKIR